MDKIDQNFYPSLFVMVMEAKTLPYTEICLIRSLNSKVTCYGLQMIKKTTCDNKIIMTIYLFFSRLLRTSQFCNVIIEHKN